MDHLPIGEGDRVLIGERKYTVSYRRGFVFQGDDGERIPAHKVTDCKLLSVGMRTQSKMHFKYQGFVFQLPAFFGCVDGRAVLSVDQEPVIAERIQVSAGLVHNKKRIFYGDSFNGHEVIMWRGRPCTIDHGHYIEVPTGTVLGGVE